MGQNHGILSLKTLKFTNGNWQKMLSVLQVIDDAKVAPPDDEDYADISSGSGDGSLEEIEE